MLQSDLCDYNDAYIVVKGKNTVIGASNRDRKNRFLAFKNNAPFISCLSKINNVLTDNGEDLDFVMTMYNLIEYSKNYKKTTRSLWNYYRDERNNSPANNYNTIINSASFKYKSNITRKSNNLSFFRNFCGIHYGQSGVIAKDSNEVTSERPTYTIWCDVIILDEIVLSRVLRIKSDFYQMLKSDF